MNAKQKRTFKVLVVIILVLAAVLATARIISDRKEKKAQEEAQAAATSNQLTDSGTVYNAITYNNGTATLSFATDEDGKWYWTNDKDFPLNQSELTSIVDTINNLTPQQTITQGDTLDAYGLTTPAATLTATAKDGTQTTFALGNATTDASSYYMLMNGKDTPVYVISDTMHSEISKGIYDMMQLPELPTLTDEKLGQVTVSGAVSTVLTPTHKTADTSSSGSGSTSAAASGSSASSSGQSTVTTTWTSAGTDVTSNDTVTALLGEIKSLSLASCVDYKPSDKAVSVCGFDSPNATVTVQYTTDAGTEGTLKLVLGGKTTDGKSYYARVNDDTTVYSISADSLSSILSVAAKGLSA